MIRAFLSLYSLRYPAVLVYMLQNTDYQAMPYLAWYWRVQDFSTVEYRRSLVHTRAADALLLLLRLGMVVQAALGIGLCIVWMLYRMPGLWGIGLALIVSYPVAWAHLIVMPLVLGRMVVIHPRNRRRIKRSEKVFREHQAEKIAILGNYGKTSMKELLLTVLSEGLRVAATPANFNVSTSHALFSRSLSGDEDVLLIEYGEGAPGDVARFAQNTHPTRAVITGVAAAHLDRYKTTEAAAQDIFSVAVYIDPKSNIYVNGESRAAAGHLESGFAVYSREGALGWKVNDIEVSIDGVTFTMRKNKRTLHLHSGLLGRHNLGPLALAVALASQLGLGDQAITDGVAKTAPFEHRMCPYELNGAWVIDDTYNGNIEGIRAGTALLKELPARRKLYATPGLVDQGKESKSIHEEMGRLIVDSGATVVVLMRNSVTDYIQAGLRDAGYQGELIIEDKALEFYSNLGNFVAAGDLIMLQNDWPDNYR